MATQALLLCRDPNVVGVLRPMLDELGLGPEVCSVPDSAVGLLQNRKYNPVIVDCEQMDSDGELLRCLRESAANRDSIALGIISDGAEVSDAFALGANLVIRKPVDTEEAGRILRTARSLVKRMRRRFLCHVLHTLAYARVDGLRDAPMLLDVGEGGVALQALDALEERRAYSLRFSLPGDPEEYEAVVSAVAGNGWLRITAGLGEQTSAVHFKSLVLKEARIIASRVTRGEFPRAIQMMSRGLLHPDLLITGVQPLASIGEAFDQVDRESPETIKIVLQVKEN